MRRVHRKKKFVLFGLVLGLLPFAGIPLAHADERLFTYSYEAEVLPKKRWEVEQWFTQRYGKQSGDFAAFDFREELEYGFLDKLTTALYLNFKSEYASHVGDSKETTNKFTFEGFSSEWKYQILNPNKDFIGLLAYFETTYSGEELELEEKIILQKNLGEKIVLVANIVSAEQWTFENDASEKAFELEFTSGAAYKLNKNWSVGVEVRNNNLYPDYATPEQTAWFVGPNVHYGNPRWWATLTVLPQVGGHPDTKDGFELEEHERIEVRLLAGINF